MLPFYTLSPNGGEGQGEGEVFFSSFNTQVKFLKWRTY